MDQEQQRPARKRDRRSKLTGGMLLKSKRIFSKAKSHRLWLGILKFIIGPLLLSVIKKLIDMSLLLQKQSASRNYPR